MDIATLALTIDGRPAVASIAAVEAALAKLPQQATAAANQVTASLNSIRAASSALGTVQVNLNQTTQQAATTTQNYSAALQIITRHLELTNGLLMRNVISTNSLNMAMGQGMAQAAHSATPAMNSLSLSLGSVLRGAGALVGIQIGVQTIRGLVVESFQANIAMQQLEYTLSAVTGTTAGAAKEIAFLREESNRIGLVFIDTANSFAKFEAATMGTSITAKQTRDIFVSFSEAGQRLHLSGGQMQSIFLALEQMASKGVVSMEELRRQLGQYLPGAFNIAARAMGVTTMEFNKMVKEGRVLSEDLLPKLAKEVANTFPLGDTADSTLAHISRVKSGWMMALAEITGSAEFQALSKTILKPVGEVLIGNASLLADRNAEERIRQSIINKLPFKETEKMVTDFEGRTMTVPVNPFADQRNFSTAGRAMQEEFPGAPRPNFYRLSGPYSAAKSIQEVIAIARKIQEQADYQNSKTKSWISEDVQPLREDTEDQQRAAKRLDEILRRSSIMGLEGLQRTLAQIDERTLDEVAKFDAALKGMSSAGKDERFPFGKKDEDKARGRITGGGEAEKELAREKVRQKALDDELKQQERIEQVVGKITDLEGGNTRDAQLARVNRQYKDHVTSLQEIVALQDGWTEQTEEAQQKLDLWNKAQTDAVNDRFRRHFIGEGNVLQLLERRKALELELLAIHQEDPEGAVRSQEIQREMRDLNQTIALQFRSGGVEAGEAFIYGLREAKERWGTEAQQWAAIGDGVANSLESNFTNAFTKMALEMKVTAAGFHEMANSIIADIFRMVVQQGISRPIAGAIMGLFGAASGTVSSGAVTPVTDFGAFGSSAGVTLHHGGGVVGMGGPSRQVGMAQFAFAPRYHGGGVVGDEVPIVARKGEAVFTPEQMAALGKAIGGGQAKQTKVEILNAYDETEVDRRIAANPSIVLNVIGRNSAAIRRMLV